MFAKAPRKALNALDKARNYGDEAFGAAGVEALGAARPWLGTLGNGKRTGWSRPRPTEPRRSGCPRSGVRPAALTGRGCSPASAPTPKRRRLRSLAPGDERADARRPSCGRATRHRYPQRSSPIDRTGCRPRAPHAPPPRMGTNQDASGDVFAPVGVRGSLPRMASWYTWAIAEVIGPGQGISRSSTELIELTSAAVPPGTSPRRCRGQCGRGCRPRRRSRGRPQSLPRGFCVMPSSAPADSGGVSSLPWRATKMFSPVHSAISPWERA